MHSKHTKQGFEPFFYMVCKIFILIKFNGLISNGWSIYLINKFYWCSEFLFSLYCVLCFGWHFQYFIAMTMKGRRCSWKSLRKLDTGFWFQTNARVKIIRDADSVKSTLTPHGGLLSCGKSRRSPSKVCATLSFIKHRILSSKYCCPFPLLLSFKQNLNNTGQNGNEKTNSH